MELSDEKFIEMANDIDDTLADLCMKVYDKYDVMPIHLLSVLLGRMGVLARELGDAEIFGKVVETASMRLSVEETTRTLQ